MKLLQNRAVLVVIGILAGYSLSRVLDGVPVINKIPKIRVG